MKDWTILRNQTVLKRPYIYLDNRQSLCDINFKCIPKKNVIVKKIV